MERVDGEESADLGAAHLNRNIHDGLHGPFQVQIARQRLRYSIEGSEQPRLRSRPLLDCLALSDVDQHVDCADEPPGWVIERRGIWNERNERTVGPLRRRFDSPHRLAGPERLRHRALIVAHRPAVRPVELP